MMPAPAPERFEPPGFIRSSFDWTGIGYHFPLPATLDFSAPAALNAADPWIRLIAAVEQCKRGNWAAVKTVEALLDEPRPETLHLIACAVLGDIGNDAALDRVAWITGDPHPVLRVAACRTCRLAGRLWLVPHMIEAWRSAGTVAERESIGYAISDLLEDDAGSLAAEAGNGPVEPFSAELAKDADPALLEAWKVLAEETEVVFPDLAVAAYGELVGRFGTDRATAWAGRLFSVAELADQLLSIAKGEMTRALGPLRRKFEASTGIDCSVFYNNGRLSTLGVAATVEEFIESGEVRRYEPGVRYFFGHPIPD